MGSLTVEGVTSIFQSDYKTTPTTDVFNETYDTLCQVSDYALGGRVRMWGEKPHLYPLLRAVYFSFRVH